MAKQDDTGNGAPSLWSVLTSVLASFFGVQSNKRREQDFTKGKPSHFIAVGLILTVAFVLVVWGVVSVVLRLATS